ncbi:protocatechuate 3,4-dioxygenase subunit alpha [Sulfitobacter sp. W074]|uniref:protocatechuate 3,4-dioxygenase subunit alpha n=1 Tax=Sulfitobacter sp. W074 TaxID=2867026 RepID=UPI0021A7539F|nr:protocatechuate 3,4-dioxygenase subunit alpha [Sulfitobacter sp. W074]UWR39557.1 protocatechuate 3,4-dioxygenase subunit alpha [Sulfitobacter sp. W074]
MVQTLDYLKETASQTAGPYVHIGLVPGDAGFDIYDHELGRDIAGPKAAGTRITVTGTVTDGTGAPVKDILIEVWQANAAGIYPGKGEVEDGFRGWGRVTPDFETGVFSFETVKPGKVTGPDARPMAPHLNLWLVARGINVGLNTRMYFDDEDEANAADPVLTLIEQPLRRETLIARADGNAYHFDIRLQGEGETVFFDL